MRLTIILALFQCIIGCVPVPGYSYAKIYEFSVVNELSTSLVKVVPLTESDFWIASIDTFVVLPGDKIIIGTMVEYGSYPKMEDIFASNDHIDSFEIFIDDQKVIKDLSLRSAWDFSQGPVNETGYYTLIINESTLEHER